MLQFNSPTSGVMYQNTLDRSAHPNLPISHGSGFFQLSSSAALVELDHSVGWFFEAQVNSIQNTTTAGSWDDYYGVSIQARDNVVSVGINLFSNGLRVVGKTVYDVLGTYSYNGVGFHTIRFESLANSMNGYLYVDSIKVLDIILNGTFPSDGKGFAFGDVSSNSDGEAYWKYVALNATAAIPEPSTYALMCVGLLGIIRRKAVGLVD
jgi:hypothetical protein